jgi:hypothetical protein
MNTQRPEWNDANNALVGFGASMVTLFYLRRFVSFCAKLLKEVEAGQIKISEEVSELFSGINQAMLEFRNLLEGSINNSDRKKILDKFGAAGSTHRLKIYSKGFSGKRESISASEIISFYNLVLEYIDHSIEANKRDDFLFHSYNLIKFENQNEISVRNLYEMLEGQVAVLNSGYLSFEESIVLIGALKDSKLFREDQSSYLLYPNRRLAQFTEKNIIPKELLEKSQLLNTMIRDKDKKIVVKDIDGKFHFNSAFRNVQQLKQTLVGLKILKNLLWKKNK